MTTWKQPSRKQWPLMIAHSLFFSSFMRHPCASSIFVDVPREYTYTVKSMIIHICAVVATVCVSRNTWHVPWFVVTNLFDAFHSTYGVKKKSKKKGKIRIVGWVEAGRRRHRHRRSQPNCGWRGCWKTTQERTVRLGRLTLDIVFWILMAFTGVSDWTSASNSWRKLRVC